MCSRALTGAVVSFILQDTLLFKCLSPLRRSEYRRLNIDEIIKCGCGLGGVTFDELVRGIYINTLKSRPDSPPVPA